MACMQTKTLEIPNCCAWWFIE